MVERPGFFDGVPVDGQCGVVLAVLEPRRITDGEDGKFAIQFVLQHLEILDPTGIVEVLENALPFLVGIVAQFADVGAVFVAPRGDLYARVPFILILFDLVGATALGLFGPTSYAELRTCAEQLVLQQQETKELLGVVLETLLVEALEVGDSIVIDDAGTVGNGLTNKINEVVFEVVVAFQLVSHGEHATGSVFGGGWVVVVGHLAPRRRLEAVERRT